MKKQIISDIIKTLIYAALVLAVSLTGAVTPLGDGAYIHLGDAMIYAAVILVPIKICMPAAVIGSVLADLMLGSYNYILFTAVIKALTVLFAFWVSKKSDKPAVQDLLISLSGIVTVLGYFIAELVLGFLKGDAFGFATELIMYNTLQALACAALYMIASGFIRMFISKKEQIKQ